MTAFNVVRFRVKPGREEDFIEAHRMAEPDFAGMRRFSMVNTGPGTYCIIGEWESFDHIVAARPVMLGMLDEMREMLEDLGSDLGLTDPVSGTAILEMVAPAAPKARARKKATRPAKPAARKTAPRSGVRKAAKKRATKRRKR